MKNIINITFQLLTVYIAFPFTCNAQSEKPNLLIISTDEHNFRTLGCYRDLMTDEQAFMWGKNTIVTTPNIDKIANEGVICTNFYASSPVCTPSRASFVSGLYPIATGSPKNNMPMHENIVTFGETLKRNGYATSYVGKWHLDGKAKPGFAPERNFGFSDNRYMFNRGHWKGFEENNEGVNILGNFNVKTATETSFSTDFLFNKALDIIKRDKNQPFCLMLSIPDPHGPNQVRPPYDTMFTNMKFENPRTMTKDGSSNPKWNFLEEGDRGKVVNKLNQNAMAQYFGMVKCIDDNIGKILNYLKESGLEKNTIVVFTSDHGDLMGEHNKNNKGLPYETSAGIAFVLRYPERIQSKKIINTAFTTIDFAPTILSIMGIEDGKPFYHGIDASEAFLNNDEIVTNDRITYITDAASKWVAAVNNRYKLVLSPVDEPWLFDLEKDPDEVINFYKDKEYKLIASRFLEELLEMIKKYEDPILNKKKLIY